ncbi:hypothetical protein IQ259_10635 [Fortiea sp. LEGE XX443]|uniref:hypothetical protein n=1 Tax=Fortiea sp. LEGE XX443 TaxID=1828611 RepID=UPI001A012483|nr:hypothetical protein [Fortiea sp. LEGE XX443]
MTIFRRSLKFLPDSQLITAYIYTILILLADDKLPSLDRTICAITEAMLNIIKSQVKKATQIY